jgi:predicted transposase YbfD/YdcC
MNNKEIIMTKRHQAPKHLKINRGELPKSDLKIFKILEEVPDPRGASCNFKHPLTTILFITLACSLCGANDWETIGLQANALSKWLSLYIDLSAGIPCVRTFKRVFEALNPNKLEELLIKVMDLMRTKKEGDIVSFDGKTMRGTVSPDLKGIHLLNAWSKENGICIGQIKVDDKSNEITAIPQLMELLDLEGTIITTDALNTQKQTACKAREKGADYFLPVKGNHATLLEEIELTFKDAMNNHFKGIDASSLETIEKSHGRVEIRKYYSVDAEGIPSAHDWLDLKSLGMVIRERTEKGKTSTEIHYYISSCEIDAKLLERATRGHWGVECLHWMLDVVFKEDKLRYRERIGAQNLSIIRKIILGVLAQDKTLKCGREGKRLIASSDPKYRELILKSIF